MRKHRVILILVALVGLFAAIVYWGNTLLIAFESNAPSTSKGTTADGSIENAKRLPSTGPNFTTYSRFGSLIGRTCVHDKVRSTVLGAYARLSNELPNREFVYAETGWPHGGGFWPHKTHENGLSIDFMVPVVTLAGDPTVLPTNLFNKYGYSVEFDKAGKNSKYSIDFEAMAAHLRAIRASAAEQGVGVKVVIFDTELQRRLFEAKGGQGLAALMKFSTKPAWVRHDEHYHIDFTVSA
ncbi:penicillin-insensitive murein DD-endopeptidase [Anaerolineae bacterium]|nr:penicillin-insensitive murein DD-endopeptidase [Anaerolineae bacterium]